MRRTARRVLVLVGATLALAACNRDRALLEAEVQRLRMERDKLANVAENLDEMQAQVRRLDEDLAAVEAMGVSLSHEDRIQRATAIPGVTGKRLNPYGPVASMSAWELGGTGADAFLALRRSDGAIAVEKAAFTPSTWVLSVPSYDPIGAYSYVPDGTPSPTPARTPTPGRFETNRTKALRAEIAALERENQELTRLLGSVDVAAAERKKADLERSLGVLTTPSRLRTVSTFAMPLFLDEKPPCAQGSLVIAQQSVRFWCKPSAGGDLEAASTRLREHLSAIEGWKVGTISIDEGAPEPLQGTLTSATP